MPSSQALKVGEYAKHKYTGRVGKIVDGNDGIEWETGFPGETNYSCLVRITQDEHDKAKVMGIITILSTNM